MARSGINVLLAALTLLIVTTLPGQTDPLPPAAPATKSHADSKPRSPTGKKSAAAQQPVLLDLKPVSTTGTVQSVAKEMTKHQSDLKDKSASNYAAHEEPMVEHSDPFAVVEFKSARQADPTSDADVVTAKNSKKSAMKNIHGTVAGSLDPGRRRNHEEAASLGARSKGGKTSVYVETDTSRAASPPH